MWSKLDEVNAARIDEKFDNIVAMKNLAEEKSAVEKKYSDLKAEVNKLMEDSEKKMQLANFAKFKEEEKFATKFEACDEARIEAEAMVAELVGENKKLKEEVLMLKEAWKIEKDEMKGENKKLEYALFDLVKAHNAKRELLKKMKQILDESGEM